MNGSGVPKSLLLDAGADHNCLDFKQPRLDCVIPRHHVPHLVRKRNQPRIIAAACVKRCEATFRSS
jgi:hypothetical protein